MRRTANRSIPSAAAFLADAVLATSAAQSEPGALRELYRRHGAAAWRLACIVAPVGAATAVAEGMAATLGAPTDEQPLRQRLLAHTREAALATPEDQPSGPCGEREAHLRALPEIQRSALWLMEVERLTPEGAAPVLGVTGGVAAKTARLARAKLTEHGQAWRAELTNLGAALRPLVPPPPPQLTGHARPPALARPAPLAARTPELLLLAPAPTTGTAVPAAAVPITGPGPVRMVTPEPDAWATAVAVAAALAQAPRDSSVIADITEANHALRRTIGRQGTARVLTGSAAAVFVLGAVTGVTILARSSGHVSQLVSPVDQNAQAQNLSTPFSPTLPPATDTELAVAPPARVRGAVPGPAITNPVSVSPAAGTLGPPTLSSAPPATKPPTAAPPTASLTPPTTVPQNPQPAPSQPSPTPSGPPQAQPASPQDSGPHGSGSPSSSPTPSPSCASVAGTALPVCFSSH